ncbi:MAG: metallophosphoesterase [Ignavibacteriae bacterium]|nr:MAG: metallophosphoesterase [Ignavibacteriota bacterium]
MNVWWKRIPYIIATAAFLTYGWVVYHRHAFRLDGVDAVLFGLVSLWYLPKFGIVPFLVIRDLIKGTVLFFHWKGQKRSMRRTEVGDYVGDSVGDSAGDSVQVAGRRAFLAKSAWGLAAVPYAMVGNGMYRTLYDYQVYEEDVVLLNLPRAMDGMRIVQISDIHAGSYVDHIAFQEARRVIDSLKADAIVITGDFVNAAPGELSIIARELAELKAPEGVYASLGNHDHYNSAADHQRLVKSIRELGIDLLVNEHRRIGSGSTSLILAGTDNTGFRQEFGDISATLNGVQPDEAVILMAHDPTYWDKHIVGQQNVQLMLSGHTHGGQFGIQAFGFEWSPAQYVYEQWAGMYRKGDQLLYVNRGLGTVGPPIRIGIPPEITVFTLRAQRVGHNLT